MRKSKISTKIFRTFVYILPAVLFFSYYPLISFGTNESMNFELSLPLIWLAVFDIYGLYLIIKFKKIKLIFKNYVWFLFLIFMLLSLFWTTDLIRGILVGGVLGLVYFAGFCLFTFKDFYLDDKFWQKFLRVFIVTSLIVCLFCLVQCGLDIFGIGREYSLACPGCTYKVFGFPHPNGFAAEPQFMGNLLLAPIVVVIYLLEKKKYFSRKFLILSLFVLIATLFLTLSRGAIYAFGVGLVFFVVVKIIREKKWQSLSLFGMTFLAFLFTLNIQGVLSEISPTNDTYVSGINKVINQLSLGVIDFGGSQIKKQEPTLHEEIIVEEEPEEETAIFDGYVEVSTSARTSIWQSALKTWTKDPQTILFGVGLGGELKAMYENGNFDSSKEIINNQYLSILLEGGLVGTLLLIISLVLLFRLIYKIPGRIYLFTLIIMYMTTLAFFSELPNALHIYLLLPVLIVFFNQISLRKKLVS